MGDEEILNHAVDLITKQGANICEPAKRDKQDWCRGVERNWSKQRRIGRRRTGRNLRFWSTNS